MKYYTSISQSKKLLELGMSPESADKVIIIDKGAEVEFTIDLEDEDDYDKYIRSYPNNMYIPCWSLGSLLELIPHTAFDGIELNNYNDGKTIWTAIFHWKTESTPIRIADTPLDAVYEVVIWLLENGYIKKEQKISSK